MQTMGVSEFRANLNAVLQQVAQGEIISLLVRGREVARIVPPTYAQNVARQELEALRSSAVVGDVMAPLDESWQEDA